MTIAAALCGVCNKNFDDVHAAIRVKQCGHLHHPGCIMTGKHITKVQNVIQRVLCPTCGKIILKQKKKGPKQLLHTKIEQLTFPQGAPSTPQPSTEVRGIKYVTYMATAFVCMILAGVIYPSFVGIGAGALIALPIGYFIGKKIDHYFAI